MPTKKGFLPKVKSNSSHLSRVVELFNEMSRMAKIGAWELDVRTMRQLWTDETYRIHDMDKARYDPNVDREVSTFTPKTRPAIEAAVRDAMYHGKPYDIEAEILTAKGNHKVLRCIGNIYKKQGKVVKIYGSVQDITEMKKLDQAKTEFVSLVSHQLRTPLTAISWYTEMILNGDVGLVSEEQKKYLEKIYEGNLRMVELVNTILDVSRIELGALRIEIKRVNVIELMQRVLEEQKPLIDRKNLKVVANFSKDIPHLFSDVKFLYVVFQNLLTNAVTYTPAKGKIDVKISVPSRESLFIRINDTGCGIPKNQQDKIFTKLFRADNARSKNTSGTGLGLYIAKSIVENLGGRIWFVSRENKGTTFYIRLPVKTKAREFISLI